MKKPSIPQGTRDFGPETVRKRNFIFNTIRSVFELYGFQPLETPAMENLDTLLGKYGEEGNQLIFKILNNGLDHSSKKEQSREAFEKILDGKNSELITERALKYDLTIPFARYVAMNYGQLHFPFKRYQVQPVWRADRPARGRYREFYQCDADIVGSHSLLNEVELVNIYLDVFSRLGLKDATIRINHRKILLGLATIAGDSSKMTDITVAIDKLDKIGLDKVKNELMSKGITESNWKNIEAYLSVSGTTEEKISSLQSMMGKDDNGRKGLEDLQFLLARIDNSKLVFDPSLARGLNYYTGVILEAMPPSSVQMGSIGGGGRYDDLTGLFGVPNVPGVGISFGVDRIYDVMESLDVFPADVHSGTTVLFFNLGEAECKKAATLMVNLRKNRISAELYDENVKFDKQFKYAEKKKIPFVVIIGEKELLDNTCNVKDLRTGQQQTISTDQLPEHFIKH